MGAFLNFTDQEGIVNNTYNKRLNAKMTYDADPTKWLSTSVNVMVNHTWGRYTPEDTGGQDARRTMIEMCQSMNLIQVNIQQVHLRQLMKSWDLKVCLTLYLS